MDAATAHRWGLVNRLTAEGGALDGALALAAAITANAPMSTSMTKQIIRDSASWPEDRIWELQRPLVEAVLASGDAKEGARAFAEKRQPDWKGI